MKKSLFLAVLLLSLASCGEKAGPLSKFNKVDGSLGCQSEALQSISTKFDKDRADEVKKQLLKAINDKNPSMVNRYLDEAYYYLYSCVDKNSAAQVRYYATLSEAYKQRNNELYNEYLEIVGWLEDAEKAAYDSKNQEIIKIVFGEMTTEEIEAYIKRLQNSEQIKALDLQMKAITDRISLESSNRPDEETYFNDGINAFYEYAPLCEQYATLCGYDSYLKYAHKELYSRKYDIADETNIVQTFKERYKNTFKKYDDKQAEKYKAFTTKSIFNKDNYLVGIVDDYASNIGGTYNDLYAHIFNDGYYYFSDNSHSLGSAYASYLYLQDEPLVYFGCNYQDLYSVIHELGHAFASKTSNNDYASYDIRETHSQTNEMLMCSYLSNNDDYKEACDYYINNFAASLFKSSSTVEIENYLFSNYKTLSKDQMKTAIKDIVSSYNGLTTNVYWIATAICSTGYYVSYVTSGIASLCMYQNTKEDFSKAKTDYLSFVTEYDGKMNEVDQWKKYNFGSPFDQSSFEKIDKIFGK